jgi:hypothetical protein
VSLAFPYLRPPEDILRCSPWALEVANGTIELSEDLPTWDYNSILALRRSISIDGDRARNTSGLTADAELQLVVRWSASASWLRGLAWSQAVPPRDDELQIAFDLPGIDLGGTLELSLMLTLVSPGSKPSRLAPTKPGSVLWADRTEVRLRGDGSRFPLAIVDFGDLLYPEGASWHLEIGADLEEPALGSILLLVNERRDIVLSALRAAADPGEADQAVLSILSTDLVRGLLERAITDEMFQASTDYPLGSVGAVLKSLLRRRFPETDLESLRREYNQDPALLASRIQAAAGLLAGRA